MPSFLRRPLAVTLAIIAFYVALALLRANTTYPWNDEAWYSSPAWSLIHRGNTGTPILEETHNFWRGINTWTYWVPPLHFYVQVPWYLVLGFSLMTARLLAMSWGLVALLAWGGIVWKLTANRATALLAMLLMACDYQFVSQVSLARVDAMAVAFAALGILAYVHFRERNLAAAVLLSQTAVVLCGISHPTPGVPAFATVAFLTLYYDRKRIGWRHLLLAAIPYIAGAAGWGLYVSIAPEYFKAQFFGNVADMDRLSGFKRPWIAFAREFDRYAGMAGFSPGLNPLYRIKAVVIALYAIATGALFLNGQTRRDPRIRPFLLLWAVLFMAMTVYDYTKEVRYGLQIVAVYDALLAIFAVRLWAKSGPAAMIAVSAFMAVSLGGILYTSLFQDAYHRSYLPMTNYLKTEAKPGDLIFAGSETGFALGFDGNVIDDRNFGYYTGKVPDWLVLGTSATDEMVRRRWAANPEYQYLTRLLESRFCKVQSFPQFEVYSRRCGDVRR